MTRALRPTGPTAARLSTRDVADRLGVSDNTVLRLVGSGELAAVNVSTKGRARLRYSEEAVAALIAARAVHKSAS